jgi:hypothetical protein
MPLDARTIERQLVSKFDFDLDVSGSHRVLTLRLPGMPLVRTFISHDRREYGNGLVSKVAKQLHVRKRFFEQMIGCTRSREDYYSKIQTDPDPPFRFCS